MSKLCCIVLCIVAASLISGKPAAAEERKSTIHEYIAPVIKECAKEYDISDDEVKNSQLKHSAEGLKPCFFGCIFKKTGFFNDQGLYDADAGLTYLRDLVKDDQQYNEYAAVARKCSTIVNDKAVSDGEAGCERGVLSATCFWDHTKE